MFTLCQWCNLHKSTEKLTMIPKPIRMVETKDLTKEKKDNFGMSFKHGWQHHSIPLITDATQCNH